VAAQHGIEGAADIEGRFGPPGLELQRVGHPRGEGRSVPLRPAPGGWQGRSWAYDSAGATIKRGKPT